MKENMKLSPPDKVGYRFFLSLKRRCQQPQLEIQIQTGSKYLTLDIMRGQIAAQVTQTERDGEGRGRRPAALMRPEDEQGIKTAAKTEMKL